jgi:hypothetical protein
MELGGGESLSVTGFLLTVSTSEPQQLQARLIDRTTQSSVSLARVEVTSVSDASNQHRLRDFARDSVDLLQSASPVFHVENENSGSNSLEHRMAVLLPCDLLSTDMRLQVFTSFTDDGSPIGADRIELVQDYFYMAAIGDSVMWGNGLEKEDKFHSIIAREIERRTGKKVIKQLLAVSGAPVAAESDDEVSCGPNCFGEAPEVIPSVITQAEALRHPELLELVLVNGCINDVRLKRIINAEVSPDEIEDITRRACHDHMQALLLQVQQLAPQAYILVTGYYQIVSMESDLFGLGEYAVVNETEPANEEEMTAFVQATSANARRFYEVSTDSLSKVVEHTNDQEVGKRIFFVDAGFGPENAIFMPNAWLWSLTEENEFIGELFENGVKLFPEDPLVDLRAEVCMEGDIKTSLPVCLFASVGHPNVQGSRVYAEAIMDTFDQANLWEELQGGS